MKKMILWTLISTMLLNACETDGTTDIKANTVDQNIPTQTIIVTPEDVCGDGKLSINEVCDTNLFSKPTSCDYYGYDEGVVKCTPNCSLDFSDCKKNNPVQEDPITDNPIQEDPIIDNPIDTPTDNPTQNTPVCGNNIKEDGEDCDSQYSVGLCSQFGDFNKGEVFCSSCSFNLSNCVKEVEPEPICGNGVRELGEECDDGNMDNTDMCTNNCMVRKCGDDILAQDEECDGSLLTITSCSDINPNYDTGSLKCSSTCEIDTSDCSVSPKCGDGVVNSSNEECDGSVGTHTCGELYDEFTGSVVCNACKLDYSDCQELCPTNREFKPGQYTNGSLTFHIVNVHGTQFIVMNNKVGQFVNDTTIQWTYSSVGDEGYYSYFNVGSCDCNSCNISFNNTSFINQDEVKTVSSKLMKYSESTISSVPSHSIPTITIPESLRTKDVYYSCNYRNCEDKSSYYLNITATYFQIYTGDNYIWFDLVKDLGDGTYLVRYNKGYKPDGVGYKPYAVINIKETQKYIVCDNFNVKDIVVTILSWSEYRDTAIGTTDFNSTDSYTYKYQVRYSATSCDNTYDTNHLADIYLTEKENRGKNLYHFSPTGYSKIYYNYCVDRTIPSVTTYNREAITNYTVDDTSAGYLSTYRDNVLVFDGFYYITYIDPVTTFIRAMDDSYSGGTAEGEDYKYDSKAYKEVYGRYQFELIFPNKSYMDEYLKVNGNIQDIGLIPSFTQNSNIEYDRWSTNNPIGLENETIVLCKVNLEDESRECKDMELSFSKTVLLHPNFKDKTYFEFADYPGGYCPR